MKDVRHLSISPKAKDYFFTIGLNDILNDGIKIKRPISVNKTLEENRWSFSVNPELCSHKDLVVFFTALFQSRREALKTLRIKEDLFFYSWYDALSGYFYVSLHPGKSVKDLVISEKPVMVKDFDSLVSVFYKDPYKGSIPIEEITFSAKDISDDESGEHLEHSSITVCAIKL
jgi:hypothetical protein